MNNELDKVTSDALASVEKAETQARQQYTDPATEARKLMSSVQPPKTERVASTILGQQPRMVPRQAPDAKLTPVEHFEQSLENLEKAQQLLFMLGERLTGTSALSEPIDKGMSTPNGVFNQLHCLANQVDRIADEIQSEVARIRDWV